MPLRGPGQLSLVVDAERLLFRASISKQTLPRMSGLGRKPPLGGRGRILSLDGENRPRLCEKSDHNEAVGKLFNFPLRLAVKPDEEWDCASKSEGFVSIFPTGDMTPDFLHSLGQKRKFVNCILSMRRRFYE